MEDFYIDEKRVGIVGSREYPDLEEVREFIGSLPPSVTIVSGGARGVDTAARSAAREFKLKYKEWPAEWNLYGRQAGFMRNAQIVKDSDIVIAFWDGISKGTQHTIELCDQFRVRCIVFNATTDGKL